MERCRSEQYQDGFESDDQKIDFFKSEDQERPENLLDLTEEMISYVTPPREIKEKPYSLHPDIMTGWAPKIPLPKPVPLTFPHDPLAQILSFYFKNKPQNMFLHYLGPRFDNTYSAWKALGVEFPYYHIGDRRITVTDRRFQGMSPESFREEGLHFESMFESGNLDAVFKVGPFQYDCFMRVDSNTRGHLQWYYFKVSNLKEEQEYQINICNFQKAKTLYSRGMKPYLLSHRSLQLKKGGWAQGGQDIQYTKKRSKTELISSQKGEQEQKKYFTLSFKISTQYEQDTLEIAYCPPYTYSKLGQYLKTIINKHQQRDIIHMEHLCTSVGGFKIPLLTISNSVQKVENEFKHGKMIKNKGMIFVMGRIHPGQANGSFMMEGFLNWLCGFTQQSQELRNKYVFKVIPMINPDGVAIGNYRTGLSGRDFNREFIDPDRTWFVEVQQLKAYLQRCKWVYQKNFQFFLDFHGHTVKKNAFTYGPQFPLTHAKYYESRLFPKLLSKKTQLFRYYSCLFKITPCKSSTARAILLRQYGLPFVYTVEASNGSYLDAETKDNAPFNEQKWFFLGEKICQTFFDYWMIVKDIQMSRERKKKEKQLKMKGKAAFSKRIQSSTQRDGNFRESSRSKIKLKTQSCLDLKQKNILSEIISQMTEEEKKENQNSDDQLSQGRSDSQNSEDDIDMTSIKSLLEGKTKEVRRRQKEVQHVKERKKPIQQVQVLKKTSFITEFENDDLEEIRRHQNIEPRKRQTHIRKKMYTTYHNSSPPLRQPESNKTSTKIVNISLILNPVAVTNPLISEKRGKLKTQVGEQYEGRQWRQPSENCRRTYLSMQRDTLKKELLKKINAQSNSMIGAGHFPFKFQEVIGKKIFSEC